MSKKVKKCRKCTIELEPDGYSVHTMELSIKYAKSDWQTCKDKLYTEQSHENANWIYPDRQQPGRHICTRYADAGVRIFLEKNKTSKGDKTFYIRMIVNPRKLIYPQSSYLGILPMEEDSIELLEKVFRTLLRQSPFERNIRNYYLSRVDLCTNVRCDNKKVFRELVRLLRKTATPKKYERIYYDNVDKKKANRYNKHYIRLACGQQELVIYDKTYQMTENDLTVDYEKLPAGVLRVELHYRRDKLRKLEKELDCDDPLDLLWTLMQQSKDRIAALVEKCYQPLSYRSFEDGLAQIDSAQYSADTKQAMRALYQQMQRKQTIDAAFAWMEKNGYPTKNLLRRFEKLELNPIPLRKGFAAQRVPSLPEILEQIESDSLTVELHEWKWK